MQKEKGVSTLTGIIVIVAVAVIAFGGVFAYQYFSKSQNPTPSTQNQNIQTIISNTQNPNTETVGWKTMDSGDGFELKYPVLNSFIAFKEPSIIRSNSNINNDGCYLGHENNIIPPNPVSEKGKVTINNINFCISQTGESAMGHGYPTYLYTTTYKNAPQNHFTIMLPFDVTACDNLKGGSNYKLCQDFFSNTSNNTDKIANKIISTFKFTK